MAMTTYRVKFHRDGAEDLLSDPFKTLHDAQTFAAKHEIEAATILIVEVDDDGEEGQIHAVERS
jgi:hypothetical protein